MNIAELLTETRPDEMKGKLDRDNTPDTLTVSDTDTPPPFPGSVGNPSTFTREATATAPDNLEKPRIEREELNDTGSLTESCPATVACLPIAREPIHSTPPPILTTGCGFSNRPWFPPSTAYRATLN